MSQRFSIIFVALCLFLTVGATTASAASSGSMQMFDLSALDGPQAEMVTQVIAGFDFDWKQLRPALRPATGRTKVKIRVRDTSKWRALGLTWPDHGLIELDDDLTDPEMFRHVLRHELGHIVDFYFLRPAGLRKKVAAVYGAPWKTMWHDFNDGFVQVASTQGVGRSAETLTDEQATRLRSLLLIPGPLPVKSAPASLHHESHVESDIHVDHDVMP
jgi:hypothetical protein